MTEAGYNIGIGDGGSRRPIVDDGEVRIVRIGGQAPQSGNQQQQQDKKPCPPVPATPPGVDLDKKIKGERLRRRMNFSNVCVLATLSLTWRYTRRRPLEPSV